MSTRESSLLSHGFFRRFWLGNFSNAFGKLYALRWKWTCVCLCRGKNTLPLVILSRRAVMGPSTASVITTAKSSKPARFSLHIAVVSWDKSCHRQSNYLCLTRDILPDIPLLLLIRPVPIFPVPFITAHILSSNKPSSPEPTESKLLGLNPEPNWGSEPGEHVSSQPPLITSVSFNL